jgi:signal peptidase I
VDSPLTQFLAAGCNECRCRRLAPCIHADRRCCYICRQLEVALAEDRTRKPWVAAVLALLLPGLGHLYNGKPRAGLFVLALQNLVLVFGVLVMAGSFAGLAACIVLLVGCSVGACFHAARQARRLGATPLSRYQRWYVYLLVVIAASIFFELVWSPLVLQGARYRAYRVPTGGMQPTLLVGDHMFVDTWAFRSRAPMRGEVATYRFPQDPSRDFVHRCVAVAGDVVEIREKHLLLNGAEQAEPYAVHLDSQVYPEALAGMLGKRDAFGPDKVGADCYFFLGDNRDSSVDSRFLGPVVRTALRAKPLYVYWSPDRSRIGKTIE